MSYQSGIHDPWISKGWANRRFIPVYLRTYPSHTPPNKICKGSGLVRTTLTSLDRLAQAKAGRRGGTWDIGTSGFVWICTVDHYVSGKGDLTIFSVPLGSWKGREKTKKEKKEHGCSLESNLAHLILRIARLLTIDLVLCFWMGKDKGLYKPWHHLEK